MKRIIVISHDRPGLLADLTEKLTQNNINIESINAMEDADNVLISLIVDQYDKTLDLLRNSEFQAVPDEVLLIRIEDKPGELAKVARTLSDNRVDIRGMTHVQHGEGSAVVAIASSDNEKAREVLAGLVLDIEKPD